MKKKIYIISTFHNEEQCINEFINRINSSFKKFKHIDYKLIFIDDFSDDLSNTLIKKACIKNKVKKVVFDRNGYPYHGRVKAVADAAREAGLEF